MIWTKSFSPFGTPELLAPAQGRDCPECAAEMRREPLGAAVHRCASCGLVAVLVDRDASDAGGYRDADGDWHACATPYRSKPFWKQAAYTPAPVSQGHEEQRMTTTTEHRDPATGRPCTPEASAHALTVHDAVWDAVEPLMDRDSATEIAAEAYRVALFRHDNPWRRAGVIKEVFPGDHGATSPVFQGSCL